MNIPIEMIDKLENEMKDMFKSLWELDKKRKRGEKS